MTPADHKLGLHTIVKVETGHGRSCYITFSDGNFVLLPDIAMLDSRLFPNHPKSDWQRERNNRAAAEARS